MFEQFYSKAAIKKIFNAHDAPSIFERNQDFLKFNANALNSEIGFKVENFSKPEQAIFISFHLGPYFGIMEYLLNSGLKTNFIASTAALSKLDYFIDISEKKGLKFNRNDIIIADTPSGIREIVTKLRNKESMFSLIDLGIGMTEISESKNSSVYKLINSEIYIRSALVNLACKFKIPVIPVYSFWKNGVKNFYFEDKMENYDHVESILIKSWNKFSEYLQENPEQWESYHTIYKTFVNKEDESLAIEENAYFRFDPEAFEIILYDGDYYICAYSTCNIYKISERVNLLIELALDDNITFYYSDLFDILKGKNIITQFYANGILTKVN